MALTALELSPQELKKYRPLEAIRKHRSKTRTEVSKRRRRAYSAAIKAATLLKEKFGATEVILFGSLARRGSFTLYSDIDLAARGIDPLKFYAAAAAIERIDVNFQFDLVELESASPTLLQNIKKDSKPL